LRARVKPIMKEPYFPKVRDVNGEKHRISREDYRKMKKRNKEESK
jgi:hypothetical protein